MAALWQLRSEGTASPSSRCDRETVIALPRKKLCSPMQRHRRLECRRTVSVNAVAHPLAVYQDSAARQPAASSRTLPTGPSPGNNVASQQASNLPIYVSLDDDILKPTISRVAYFEALKAGLRAVRLLGVVGVVLEVYWGAVEHDNPQEYDWAAYKEVMQLVRDEGLTLQVALCFHSNDHVTLPSWVLDVGLQNPDIYFTDRAGNRNLECLTFGIDDVPVLAGRSAVTTYQQFIHAFREEFSDWLGSCITEIVIGLGPAGELRYPSQPSDMRWNFPGIGEFQCYDKYMLSTLKACTQQLSQPSWGLGGPHDAGNYCLWPHQTGFFHQHGNWASPYGAFFLQWYGEMMMQHADRVMSTAQRALRGSGTRLSARVPCVHWWYHSASHAAECTAGYYATRDRDAYLPVLKVLEAHGAGVQLRMSEMRHAEAACDPECLLAQQRLAATALGLPVALHAATPAVYDEASFARLEAVAFDNSTLHGVELGQANSIILHRLSDAMFDPVAWPRVKAFLARVRDRAAAQGTRPAGSTSGIAAHTGAHTHSRAVGSGMDGMPAGGRGQSTGGMHASQGGSKDRTLQLA